MNSTIITPFIQSLYAAPFGLGFLALVLFVTVFHESDRVPILPFLGSYFIGWLYLNGTMAVWTFVFTQYLKCLLFLVAYFVIGMAWTIPKLAIFVRKSKVQDELQKRIETIKRGSAAAINPEQIAAEFLSKHKWQIYLWTMYWPVNILFTLVRDPARILYEFAYEQLLRTYTNIVVRVLNTIIAKQKNE